MNYDLVEGLSTDEILDMYNDVAENNGNYIAGSYIHKYGTCADGYTCSYYSREAHSCISPYTKPAWVFLSDDGTKVCFWEQTYYRTCGCDRSGTYWLQCHVIADCVND